MSVASAIRGQLARRVPKLDDRLALAAWRRRNRARTVDGAPLPLGLAGVVEQLRRNGVAITDVETVFGDRTLFDEAARKAKGLYEQPREEVDAAAGSKATFLTKLASGSFAWDDPFARLALHPSALAVANGYLELRSTLRSIDLWLTEPTSGPAIQTQLWHRDADDVVNVKMFVYFTDVARGAGPLCYAPETHPTGGKRRVPERDEQGRSTDEQLGEVVPERDWVYCEGPSGTVVFADTCGYHKQTKPETAERLLLVSHFVSGSAFVPRALELTGVDERELTDDQYVAVFDRPRIKPS
jgi:Phytanoyl-CoA dioxygenase (PhyH)